MIKQTEYSKLNLTSKPASWSTELLDIYPTMRGITGDLILTRAQLYLCRVEDDTPVSVFLAAYNTLAEARARVARVNVLCEALNLVYEEVTILEDKAAQFRRALNDKALELYGSPFERIPESHQLRVRSETAREWEIKDDEAARARLFGNKPVRGQGYAR